MRWWIFHFPPFHTFRHWRTLRGYASFMGGPYVFRNLDRVHPKGRWGGGLWGFEVGSRDPRNRFGIWLKRIGLWPW